MGKELINKQYLDRIIQERDFYLMGLGSCAPMWDNLKLEGRCTYRKLVLECSKKIPTFPWNCEFFKKMFWCFIKDKWDIHDDSGIYSKTIDHVHSIRIESGELVKVSCTLHLALEFSACNSDSWKMPESLTITATSCSTEFTFIYKPKPHGAAKSAAKNAWTRNVLENLELQYMTSKVSEPHENDQVPKHLEGDLDFITCLHKEIKGIVHWQAQIIDDLISANNLPAAEIYRWYRIGNTHVLMTNDGFFIEAPDPRDGASEPSVKIELPIVITNKPKQESVQESVHIMILGALYPIV